MRAVVTSLSMDDWPKRVLGPHGFGGDFFFFPSGGRIFFRIHGSEEGNGIGCGCAGRWRIRAGESRPTCSLSGDLKGHRVSITRERGRTRTFVSVARS